VASAYPLAAMIVILTVKKPIGEFYGPKAG
jgi:hypothetical protein